MNVQANFPTRSCPGCGSTISKPEASSDRAAETLTLDGLRPYWRGLFQEKIFFTYERCAGCGLLYAPRFFDGAQLTDLYSAMEPNMDSVSTEAIEATQRVYFQEAMDGLESTGGYLEIGPDVGYIVGHASRTAQFDHFYLFEPNRAVHAELAATTGGKPHSISADMTDLSGVPDESVALAMMVHVLDHLLDPRAMLEQIRRKLKKDGRLVIVTHNERSMLRTVMGKRWPPFCLQHPEIYNPESIATLLRSAGFGSAEVRRSKNYFPISFMVRQAAHSFGVKLGRMPLPGTVLGLRLGNIITFAQR
ncbi:MAG TPA: class I SAM-dependent methyltransferase [Sphingomicrobium sp.]|nr:class I SAM-dependent methyltransferase [Sphingomicrobium sp.]